MSRSIAGLAIGIAMAGGCSPSSRSGSRPDGALASSEIAAAIRGAVQAPDSPSAPRPEWERAALAALYEPSAYAPLWTDDGGRPGSGAREALAMLSRASDEGLDPVDYRAEWLEQFATRLDADAPSSTAIAGFDAALSRSVLRYYRHLHRGRVDPRDVGYAPTTARDAEDVAGSVRSAVAERRVTERAMELAPRLAEYGALRSMLVRYRALASGARLEPPAVTIPLRPGQPMAGTDRLYRLLVALGDLPRGTLAPDGLTRFEGPLVDGVKRFQSRHGLDATGVFGSETQAAFNVPFAQRVRQIELALERLRWWPIENGDRVVIVNRPMARLWAWNAGAISGPPTLTAAVTPARTTVTTPAIVEDVREVVFRPLPEDDRVCRTGTLAPYLFVAARGLSDCAAVADAVGLAAWALSGQQGWNEGRVRASADGAGAARVVLASPVRVVLSDNTAAMPGDGMLHFAPDIHARDEELHRALIGRPRVE